MARKDKIELIFRFLVDNIEIVKNHMFSLKLLERIRDLFCFSCIFGMVMQLRGSCPHGGSRDRDHEHEFGCNTKIFSFAYSIHNEVCSTRSNTETRGIFALELDYGIGSGDTDGQRHVLRLSSDGRSANLVLLTQSKGDWYAHCAPESMRLDFRV